MAYGKEEGEKPGKETDEAILEEAREGLKECVDEEDIERAKMQDDLRFCTLDQWPQEIRAEREGDIENGARPCLTIDKINQYIVQVVNDMRQGKPGINVRPQDNAADVETAKILKGLVRNIEDQSNADIAYYVAGESAARIGLGYFRITTEYVSDDSFDQELFIRPIPNTFSVYLGKHIMPDGSDAEHGYICESIPVAKFKEMFPKAKVEQKEFDGLDKNVMGYWRTAETVTVVEYYCIKKSLEELLFLEDGTTITKSDYDEWPEDVVGPKPAVVEKRMREKRSLKWRKLSGVEVLEKRDLPGQYIPIVEVVGREAWVDGRRIVWGLVRPAKDSLRMYNYWASTITERMALAPKQPYVGAKGQFEGLEHIWAKANRVNRPYLEYNVVDVNGNAIPPPQRVGPTPIEAALLQQMQVIEHDVQTSLGMFKAAVGETESQQSGRAILALQRESDTGTYHFGANQGMSIRHAGRILVDLIPHYYDTKRIVRILGEDGEVQTATLDPELNTPYQKTPGGVRFNPGMGKYDVSITVGPSYNTKRMEAAATFVELAKGAADPASAAVLRYLTVQNSDFSGSDVAAKALKALLPPPVLQAMSGGQQMPPEAQAMVAQAQQQVQMLQQELQEEQAGTKQAMAKVQVDAQAKQAQIQAEREAMEAEFALKRAIAQEEARLKREIAEAEAKLKRDIAEAEHAVAKRDAEMKREIAENEHGIKMMGAEVERRTKMKELLGDDQFKEHMGQELGMSRSMVAALERITQVVEGMLTMQQQMNAQQQQTNQQLVEALNRPKQIALGGFKRASDGGITGASATVQ